MLVLILLLTRVLSEILVRQNKFPGGTATNKNMTEQQLPEE